ncbi:MAG: undecaprenyl-diphosphate phosphatase, partial [Chloroflexi bacterium]|nr:undecaprenyl-diphosphate phosphatase [Chloroflexota bacterium]
NIPAEQIFPFDVLVQLGTLVAVIIYFWRDILEICKAIFSDFKAKKLGSSSESRLGWFLILATIPAGAAGLLLKDMVEQAFGSPSAAAFFLFGTALLLILAELIGKRNRDLIDLRWFDALWIGLFQVLALFPGLSRSGSCMAGGMTRHLARRSAGRFSFLMAIPVMAAAGLLSVFDLLKVPNLGQFIPVMLVGFIIAGVVGYLSISWLMNFVQSHSLFIFAGYCLFLGAAVLAFGFVFPQNPSPAAAVSETPSPEEQFLPSSIVYTPELNWIAPSAATCMEQTLSEPLPLLQSVAAYQPAELRLTFPLPSEQAAYSYQLGSQTLTLALNATNPLRSLSFDDLITLLQEDDATWGGFFQHCASCSFSEEGSASFDGEIKLYIYYEGSPYQNAVVEASGLNTASMNGALFIPSAEALLTQLQLEPNAVGFLPSHWLTSAIISVQISNLPAASLELPILALLDQQPSGELKDFLLCLQSSLD